MVEKFAGMKPVKKELFEKNGTAINESFLHVIEYPFILGENWQKAPLATKIMQKNKIFRFTIIKK